MMIGAAVCVDRIIDFRQTILDTIASAGDCVVFLEEFLGALDGLRAVLGVNLKSQA